MAILSDWDNYIIIDDANSDLRFIKNTKGSFIIENIEASSYKKISDELWDYHYYVLGSRNIPHDNILIRGKPGIIVPSWVHSALLKNFITKKIRNNNDYANELSNPRTLFSIDYINDLEEVKPVVVSNIRINDTLHGIIPLKLVVEPIIYVDGKPVNPCKELGIEEEFQKEISTIIKLDDFINEARRTLGLKVPLTFDGKEITSYEDYFNMFINRDISYTDDGLTLDPGEISMEFSRFY